MKYIILILLMLSFVSAGCVDINSASLEELDEIIGIGNKTAQKIIDARPFDSVDDLTKVSGIAEKKLAKIKSQGLACVDGEIEEIEGEDEGEEVEEIIDENEVSKVKVLSSEPKEIILNSREEVISLNGEEKSELIYESKDSKIMNWIPYAFSVFLIALVGILVWERF